MLAGLPVVVIERGLQTEVRDPAAVQKERRLQMRGQEVVAGTGALAGEGVGVVFRVHATDVPGQAGLEAEHPAERDAVLGREAAAGIGGVGRAQLLRRPRPLAAEVQHAASHFHAFGNAGVIGAGIDGKTEVERRTALFRDDADHTRAEVAVLRRRNAGQHFDGLDVLHLQRPGIDALHARETGVVAHADAVDLHGRGEGGIAGALSSPAKGKLRLRRQVRIDRLAAGHQRGDIADAGHLEVFQRRPAERAGRIDVVLGALGRDDDLFERQ